MTMVKPAGTNKDRQISARVTKQFTTTVNGYRCYVTEYTTDEMFDYMRTYFGARAETLPLVECRAWAKTSRAWRKLKTTPAVIRQTFKSYSVVRGSAFRVTIGRYGPYVAWSAEKMCEPDDVAFFKEA